MLVHAEDRFLMNMVCLEEVSSPIQDPHGRWVIVAYDIDDTSLKSLGADDDFFTAQMTARRNLLALKQARSRF